MSKWLGEAEKNVAKLFSMAHTLSLNEGVSVILFIDEIDSLLGIAAVKWAGRLE